MSHLAELKFMRTDKQPFDDIVDVSGLIMTSAEQSRRAVVTGQVVKVTPGVFLIGLSGDANDRQRNADFLRQLPWLDIPIIFRDGTQAVLGLEKGAAGQQAFDEVFGP